MNLSALFKIFAVLLAKRDNFDGGSLNGTVSPTASLQIDLNTGEVLSNKNGTIDNSNEIDASHQGVSLQPIASDPSVPKQLDVDDGQNGITALEVRPSPGGMIAIPYFPHESDRVGPKAALKNCVKSMEEQTLWRLHNVYVKIGEYNTYNYESNQQAQYLNYGEKEKKEMNTRSQELKDAILPAYVRLRVFMKALEKFRAKLTTWSDEYPSIFNTTDLYWPQPETTPELWYLLFNTETIIMQLFTPKPPIHTSLDEETNSIRFLRVPDVQMTPRVFMPVPQYNIDNNNALDRLFNGPAESENAQNEFEQATFSKNDYEQQVIVYYMFKYFEYKTGDSARHVNYISDKLAELQAAAAPDQMKIKELKDVLPKIVKEMQYAAMQMETYRISPALTEVYNAEVNAMRFIPAHHVTTLTGKDHKRVGIKPAADAMMALKSAPRTDIEKPIIGANTGEGISTALQWDRNFQWDT